MPIHVDSTNTSSKRAPNCEITNSSSHANPCKNIMRRGPAAAAWDLLAKARCARE